MKKILFFAVLLLACSSIKAQYFCTTEGTQLQYVNYDDAGQSVSNETMTVRNVVRHDNVTAQYISKIVNTNSKVSYTLFDWSYDGFQTLCREDLLYGPYIESDLDPAKYDSIARKVMEDERKFKGDNSFIIKDDAKGGESMPDRSYSLIQNLLKNDVNISGAAYMGNETVSTTAGKFADCIKISYLKRTKIVLKSQTVRVTEWYAKGVGLVKSESFDTKGKSYGKTILVKIVKP